MTVSWMIFVWFVGLIALCIYTNYLWCKEYNELNKELHRLLGILKKMNDRRQLYEDGIYNLKVESFTDKGEVKS